MIMGIVASGPIGCRPDGDTTGDTTSSAVQEPNLTQQPAARAIDKEELDQAKKKLETQPQQQ